MKSLLLAVLSMTFSAAAYANTCVEDATNEELMNEVSRRLYLDDSPSTDMEVSATCNSWTVSINLINLFTGHETTEEIKAGGGNDCRNLASRINNRLSGKTLNKSVIIANCNSWTVARVLVSGRGELKRLDDKKMGSSSECRNEAQRINSRW